MGIQLKNGLLTSILGLLFTFPAAKSLGSIEEITKQYQGVYSCVEFRYGEFDLKEDCRDFTLELKDGDVAVFTIKEPNGTKKVWEGNYDYDAQKGVLILTLKKGFSEFSKKFTLQKGKITFTFPMCGKTVYGVFEQS